MWVEVFTSSGLRTGMWIEKVFYWKMYELGFGVGGGSVYLREELVGKIPLAL